MHPLFSDHPDIQKAWKVWDELIFLGEKKNKDDISQNPENSDETKSKDVVLSKDGSEAKVIAENKSDSISISDRTERRKDIMCDDLR